MLACCASASFAAAIAGGRPYRDPAALRDAVNAAFTALSWDDIVEAMNGHPRIGDRVPGGGWSAAEQSGAASADNAARQALADGNLAYEQRFGHVFLICASGLSGQDMLDQLQARLGHGPEAERAVVREELLKITLLRLTRLLGLLAEWSSRRPARGGGRHPRRHRPGPDPRPGPARAHREDLAPATSEGDEDHALRVQGRAAYRHRDDVAGVHVQVAQVIGGETARRAGGGRVAGVARGHGDERGAGPERALDLNDRIVAGAGGVVRAVPARRPGRVIDRLGQVKDPQAPVPGSRDVRVDLLLVPWLVSMKSPAKRGSKPVPPRWSPGRSGPA